MKNEENNAHLAGLYQRSESFFDFSGAVREFIVTQLPRDAEFGAMVRAVEVTDTPPGYEFSSWSPTLGDALGKIRGKIRKRLSTRYAIERPDRTIAMTHDRLVGTIASEGLVVDGKLLGWQALIDLLLVNNGDDIKVRVSDPTA